MAVSARKHTVPAGGETPRRQAVNDLAASINDIVPVANATERTQLVTDLTAAGVGPSSARPLYVDRADAPAHSSIERTTDGTTWRSVALQGDTVDLSYVTGWQNYGDSSVGRPVLSQVGRRVSMLSGPVGRSSGTTVTSDTELNLCPAGTIPVGMRPAAIRMWQGLIIAGTSEVSVTLRAKPDGSITYVALGNITMSTGNSNYLLVTDVPWDV